MSLILNSAEEKDLRKHLKRVRVLVKKSQFDKGAVLEHLAAIDTLLSPERLDSSHVLYASSTQMAAMDSALSNIEEYWRCKKRLLKADDQTLIEIKKTPILELQLPARQLNSLARANITYVGELFEQDDFLLLRVRNFGEMSRHQTFECVDQYLEQHFGL